MPAEIKKEIELGIAHLLLVDIVAYSKLSINEQFRKAEAAKPDLKDPYQRWHGAGLLPRARRNRHVERAEEKIRAENLIAEEISVGKDFELL